MLPTLLQTPYFEIRSMPFFVITAYLVALFFFWRKAREEHYDEATMFDAFFLSTLVGLLFARVSFIILNWQLFGFSLVAWLDVFNHPGSYIFVGLVGAAIYVSQYAHKQKWDHYEVLDFWSIAVAAGLAVRYVGLFFDGSQYGTPTSLPWGVVFSGLLEPHHPVQLYKAVVCGVLVWYLSWVELRYRTYEWYRVGKRNAQTGFLLSMFLLFIGVLHIVLYPVSSTSLTVFGLPVYVFGSVLAIFLGLALLLIRSGKIPYFTKR